jgi:hypothetical protein
MARTITEIELNHGVPEQAYGASTALLGRI